MPARPSLRLLAAACAAMAAACTGGGGEATTTRPPPTTLAPTTTTAAGATTTVPPDCPPPPYVVGVFPSGVSGDPVPAEDIALDEFTSLPGTSSQLWLGDDGGLALALVRGALPPEQWPGPRQEVSIDGARGVVGPFDDGKWVLAWFEEPGDRCDQYTMVFYPPVEPSEVEATIESLDRRAG